MSQLSITLVQTPLIWEDKAANLAMLTNTIDAIGATEIVVLPEMFTTGFSMQPQQFAETMDGDAVEWMKTTAAKKKIVLCGSMMMHENDQYTNRLLWVLPNGQIGFYDKRHLFALGEEHQHYHAGSKRLIASVKGWRINLQICYDLRFPVWARQQSSEEQPEYDVLIYVANWPERRNHAWKSLLVARAIENQCYCIGVNRVGEDGKGVAHSGDSMVVDPLGEVLFTKANDAITHTIQLDKTKLDEIRRQFPFWKDADHFQIGME